MTSKPIALNGGDDAKIAELEQTIRELVHLQLIARDTELGLRAELEQSRIELKRAQDHAMHIANLIRTSNTWRVGRAITAVPFAFRKRPGRSAK